MPADGIATPPLSDFETFTLCRWRRAVITIKPSNVIYPAISRHGVLLLFVLIHAAIAQLISNMTGREFSSSTYTFLLRFMFLLFPVYAFSLLVCRFFWIAVVVRPGNPMSVVWNDIKKIFSDPHRLASGIIAFMAISIFSPSFSFLKDTIPVFNPFSWDVFFGQMDRAMHFGFDPYRILLPVLGSPFVVTALNAVYHFWFFLMFFIVTMACFVRRKPVARMTFLLAYVLTWAVGGNLLATVFSSAGPVYYARLGFGDTFQPLMDHLAYSATISPVWALNLQEALWAGYQGSGNKFGISAMPSMHIASSTLMMLFVFQYSRVAGWALAVFLFLILLGSVVLGWHYAIDGYAGAIIAVAMWKLAAKIAVRPGLTYLEMPAPSNS
jgi:PAP2 superfamily